MDLESRPAQGIRVDQDLSEIRVTLTRQRGGDMIKGIVTAAMILGLSLFFGMDTAVYTGALMLPAGLVLNLVKSEIVLGPRSLRVEQRRFGLAGAVDVVPYEAITGIRHERGRFATHRMVIERVGGAPIVLVHGSEADHAELQLAIDARRPIRRLPEPHELQVPAELRAMRAKTTS